MTWRLPRIFRLHAPELGVKPVGLAQKLTMPAFLDNAAIVQRNDAVAILNGGQSMRDDDHGAALADGAHIGLDDALASVIAAQ